MEKVIGTNQISYPQIRNFVDLPHGFEFVEERDVFTTLLNQYFRVFKKVPPLLKFLHYHATPSKIKLRHFFNTISFNDTPWIVTFETTLPRLGNAPSWIYNLAIKRLASASCKKIIALSQNAYNLQLNYLNENYPAYLDAIRSKMVIMHPSQKVVIKDYLEKQIPSDKIVFTLVGSDFFRKGGREVLNVFDKLLPNYPQLQLNIVSTMAYGDYASKTLHQDLEKALKIINKYPNNIKHYKSLSNKEVLELFKRSHIGLLPTWGDSYGYTVLEAQAAGCPAISTDLRALPEINDNDCGWVINVPKLANGNADILTADKRLNFQSILEKNLNDIIILIVRNKMKIQINAETALQNIKVKHNVSANAKYLNDLYIFVESS